METKNGRDFSPVNLKEFDRSPRLAEIRATYKSRTKVSAMRRVREPAHVAEYLREIWNPGTIELSEDFIVLCLNNAHQVIGWVKVAQGGCSGAQVDPRIIFAVALQTGSASLIVAHNHPSGELSPSDEDRRLTERLAQAGKLLGIRVLDHVILGEEGYFSFADSGLM